MYTTDAIITDVIREETKVWLQLDFDNKEFPSHWEFNLATLRDIEKIFFLIKCTKAGTINGLKGKQVRVIDTEEVQNSLLAIGSPSKNKFIDLYGSEFPVSEKRLYRRYRKKR